MVVIYINQKTLDRLNKVKEKIFEETQPLSGISREIYKPIDKPSDIKSDYAISYLLSRLGY
jgi:hypothetical protein